MNENAPAQPAGTQASGPHIGLLAQYVHDLSFENPNAPDSLKAQGQPRIEFSVKIDVTSCEPWTDEGKTYQVSLTLHAAANQLDGTPLFVVEVVYCGLFALNQVPEEAVEGFLNIEAPRILFPFARRVLADATRDGGFPPLLLDPIDFGALHAAQKNSANGQGIGQPPVA